jgi:hypothetical protein
MNATRSDPAEDVRRHLEECGYVVERPRAAEPSLLLARHAQRPAVAIKAFPGAVRLTTAFRLPERLRGDRLALLEAVNEYNRRSIGVCACVNQRGELAVEGFLYVAYERAAFHDFLRRIWDRELDRLARESAFSELEAHEAPPYHERL